MVQVQLNRNIGFPYIHTTYHFPYIFLFNGMIEVDHELIEIRWE
jgi:hypothetical protein